MAGNLETAILLSKLRSKDPMAGSVMSRPAAPEWQPEYQRQEEGLEAVSPEDFIPNPKSMIAALKGAPVLVGALRSKIPELGILNKAGKELFGNEGSGYLPYKSGPVTEKSLSRYVKENILDTFDKEPYNIFNDMTGDIALSELPRAELAKRLRDNLLTNQSFNYLLGVQGLAHGVEPATGKALPLNSVNDLLGKKTFVGAHTGDPEHSFYRLNDSSRSVGELVDSIMKLYPVQLQATKRATTTAPAMTEYAVKSFNNMIENSKGVAAKYREQGRLAEAVAQDEATARLVAELSRRLGGQ